MVPVAFLPALLAPAGAVLIFLAARWRRHIGLVTSVVFATAACAYLAADQNSHRPVQLGLVEWGAIAAIVGITVVPGALLALLAAHRQGTARNALLIGAVLVSAALGTASLVTYLAVWCACTGDCL